MNKVISISYKTRFHSRFNTSRGMIFLSEFDIDYVQLFKEELRENYNVSEIERAEFTKARSSNTKAFTSLLSMRKNFLTLFIFLESVRT